jgi:DNA polymerase-1
VTWLPEGRRLLTIRTDCELPVEVSHLVPRAADAAKLKALFERFEFKSWIKDLGNGAQSAASLTQEVTGEISREPQHANAITTRQYELVLDELAFERLLGEIATATLVCFDTETTGLDPMQARLVGLAFSIEPGHAYYIPLAHSYAGVPAQLPFEHVLSRLKPWFEDANAKKLGQNVKFDQHVLANHGIALAGVAHDILLQSYVLESHRPHDRDNLAWRYLDWKTLTYAEIAGKGVNQIGFEQVALDRATEYAAEDADVTLQLHGLLHPRIAGDAKLDFVYSSIELPTREVLFRMEREGILIDGALLAVQSRELGERIMELETKAFQEAGQPFNLASPRQLGEILFNRMQLPVVKKTSTGQPSTDEDVLQQLAADYPLPKLLLEHRALSKLKSTYTDKLPQMVNPRTGRVHTCFGQATAVTGRLASTDPNLQNIPVRTAEGRRIREAFIAPVDHVMVSADYSQIELRIMAHLSADKSLLDAFSAGADIHRATAAEIFGVSIDQVTADQRRYIKAVNFGLIYGMSAFGLAAQLGIERSAAQQFIDKYFARYPGVAEYMRRTRELARRQGFVETVFGRRLWLPDINAGGGPRRQGAERAAINAPMQGTAADLIKLAMVVVQRWLDSERLATRLVLQVHDELVLEVPGQELERIQRELPGLMSGVAALDVPLVVDLGCGPNWEQAH